MSASSAASYLIGNSDAMQYLRAQVSRAASSGISILIEGPTGSGKELVAQSLHAESARKGRLVAVNVCAIADTMFEDAMFGHVRGAFSGAIGDHAGHLSEAHQGTMFLDEIGGLQLGAQIKLLRAIETKEFRPVGAQSDRTSDFRLITATNAPLDRAVESGAFRADLAYRLSGALIRVPPLAAHREDIPMLARHFARRASAARGVEIEVSESASALLASQSWPGNVRQLRQLLECAVAFATSARIGREEIAQLLNASQTAPMNASNAFERRRLLDTIRDCEGDLTRAARHLGVHRTSIYRRVHRLGIDLASFRNAEDRRAGGATKAGLPLAEPNSIELA